MISVANRGQQASRTSSKTTKNGYQTTAGGSNVRGSYSGAKGTGSSQTTKAGTSLQTTERMTGGTASGSTKRSSSVKNPNSGSSTVHHRKNSNDKEHHHHHGYAQQRKGSGSNGYSNLAQYEHHHPRRDRGNSAQPLSGSYTNSSGPAVNPLIVTNIVNRSSSTTNKNKKVNTINGSANFQNLVLNGSHSTKHSTQGNTALQSGQTRNNTERGGSQDRHQSTKAHSSSRTTTRVKSASVKNHDSKDEHHRPKQSSGTVKYSVSLKQQQDQHLQRIQKVTQNQLSATQRISPGTLLNYSQP